MTRKMMLLLSTAFMLLNLVDIVISQYGIFGIGLYEINNAVYVHPFWYISCLKVVAGLVACGSVFMLSKYVLSYATRLMTVAVLFYSGVIGNNLFLIWRFS